MVTDPQHEVAVRAESLEKRFGRFVAVNAVSFQVKKGEIFGFLGPNGAGKSTTIRMLCGILSPSAGKGVVAGYDIQTETERIKASIGYMSQRFSLYDDLTVAENIRFFSGIYNLPASRRKERRHWALEMSDLVEQRNRRTRDLPGGWKQRLALSCALLHEPPIVFLDEPTSGVDPINRRHFWDLIHDLAHGGVTVFVTTHYMDEAEYCDRVALIYRGNLIASGSPETLRRETMRHTVLGVESSDPMSALELMESKTGILQVALFGNGLHVVVEDPDREAVRIEEWLTSAGLAVSRIEPIAPSMEDTFISLIEAYDSKTENKGEVHS